MASYTIPPMPLPISIWRYSTWAGTVPPVGGADVSGYGNLTPGRRVWIGETAGPSFLLVLAGLDIRFSESGVFTVLPTSDPDLVEVPTGSARYYTVADTEQLGMGFANWHQEAALLKTSPWPVPAPPPPSGSLLLEDGTSYLLEDATDILLE